MRLNVEHFLRWELLRMAQMDAGPFLDASMTAQVRKAELCAIRIKIKINSIKGKLSAECAFFLTGGLGNGLRFAISSR